MDFNQRFWACVLVLFTCLVFGAPLFLVGYVIVGERLAYANRSEAEDLRDATAEYEKECRRSKTDCSTFTGPHIREAGKVYTYTWQATGGCTVEVSIFYLPSDIVTTSSCHESEVPRQYRR